MAKKTAAKKEAKKRGGNKGQGIGAYAKQLIIEGLTNPEVLAKVQAKFPESKINNGTVGWYRNKVQETNSRVKNSREIAAKQKKAAAKDAAPVKKAAKKTNHSAEESIATEVSQQPTSTEAADLLV